MLHQKISSDLKSSQLKFDVEKNIDNIYGVTGSDARISIWHPVPVKSSSHQPMDLQFNLYVQVGQMIYLMRDSILLLTQTFTQTRQLMNCGHLISIHTNGP